MGGCLRGNIPSGLLGRAGDRGAQVSLAGGPLPTARRFGVAERRSVRADNLGAGALREAFSAARLPPQPQLLVVSAGAAAGAAALV